MSSAPKGRDVPISEEDAIKRTLDIPVDPDDDNSPALGDTDRNLDALVYTGGSTEYAHIYLAVMTGEYNGNEMLWVRYVWLSKPGAFESDMFGSNGMSMRMVPGMADAVTKAIIAGCQSIKQDRDRDGENEYTDTRYLEA